MAASGAVPKSQPRWLSGWDDQSTLVAAGTTCSAWAEALMCHDPSMKRAPRPNKPLLKKLPQEVDKLQQAHPEARVELWKDEHRLGLKPIQPGSGRGLEAASRRWSDRAINGGTSTGVPSHRAERLRGSSCPLSIRKPFLWPSLSSHKNRELGQTSTFCWFWIRQVGTKAESFRFPKGCICSFCHRIRPNCSLLNGSGLSPMSRWPIGSSTRSMS